MSVQEDPALLVHRDGTDVGASRERLRRRRLRTLTVILGVPAAFLWLRILRNDPFNVFALPHIDSIMAMQLLIVVAIIGSVLIMFVGGGRSPHVLYRPEQIDVRLDDIKGIDGVKEEVVRSLNLFLAHRKFADAMGGTPRRGLLFEGAPGTGKTYLAKAMAREAGVPFLFVSATSFQSMYYGATARKIRSYFKALRKAARAGGRCDRVHRGDRRDRRRSRWPVGDHAAGGAARHRPAGRLRRPQRAAGAVRRWDAGHGPEPQHGLRGRRRRRQRAARPDAVLRRAHRVAEGPGQGHRLGQPLPAGEPAAAATDPAGHHGAAHRGHQPGGQPGPGAAPAGPLRPPAHLRVADQDGTAGADRLLPGPQVARARAGRRRAPRRDRLGDPGLHPGDDRAPLRRGPGQRGPPGRPRP